jgi:hypothetical protein
MKALVYRNTKSTIPGWDSVHKQQQRGVAYETDTHFVHIYGAAEGLWTISNGLTVTKKKEGALSDWVKQTFGQKISSIRTSMLALPSKASGGPGSITTRRSCKG